MTQRNQEGCEDQNEPIHITEAMMLPAINSDRISGLVHSEIGFPPPGIVLSWLKVEYFSEHP